MPDFYRRFYDATRAFQKKEPRAFCYDLAMSLIRQAKDDHTQSWYRNLQTTQGIILLLFCWNFAAKKTKKITIARTRRLLQRNERRLRQLENYCLLNFPADAEPLIKKVFSEFLNEFGQTGATKALSLLNTSLFVMWDTKIRAYLRCKRLIPQIGRGETSDQYLQFLKGLRNYSNQYNFTARLTDPNAVLAKKIDEYHYVKIIINGRRCRRPRQH
jgi:hypothetical protein